MLGHQTRLSGKPWFEALVLRKPENIQVCGRSGRQVGSVAGVVRGIVGQ